MTENRQDYNPPVADLLTIGNAFELADDYDYLAHAISVQDLPELHRLALDETLLGLDDGSDAMWAPIHALRTIGQRRDPAGIPTLLAALHNMEEWDDDWSIDEIPQALGLIGAAAIDPLQPLLADRELYFYARIAAAEGLVKIATYHPSARARVVAILAQQLQNFANEEREFNAFMISSLLNLQAVEAAPVMEHAFAADKVDWAIQGDWEEVQIALGLLTERVTPKPARWNNLDGYFGELRPEQGQTQEKRVNPFAAAQKAFDAKLKKQRNAKKLAKQTKQKQRAQKKKKRK